METTDIQQAAIERLNQRLAENKAKYAAGGNDRHASIHFYHNVFSSSDKNITVKLSLVDYINENGEAEILTRFYIVGPDGGTIDLFKQYTEQEGAMYLKKLQPYQL